MKNRYIHSMRQQSEADFLKGIGVDNVINTNCVTTWGLDNISASIPTEKADNVVFTMNMEADLLPEREVVEHLRRNYKNLYYWPQSMGDLNLLKDSGEYHDVTVLDSTLKAYDEFLKSTDTDYVGMRLHGGIHALNKGKRTIILGSGERAQIFYKDINLPVLDLRKRDSLKDIINGHWKTEVHTNLDNRKRWLQWLGEEFAID